MRMKAICLAALVAILSLTGCGGESKADRAVEECTRAAQEEGVRDIEGMQTSNDGIDSSNGWMVEVVGYGSRDGATVKVICLVTHILDTDEWTAIPLIN